MADQNNEGPGLSLGVPAPRILLFLLTILCVCSMGFYYFKKENIVSVTQAAGLILVPVQKGINYAGSYLFDLEQEKIALSDALDRIEELEAENEELNSQIRSYDMMVYDYKQVRQLLDLKNTYLEYDTVGADIVFASTSGNWYSTVTIDKGSLDGIKVNMNVIADGGLVGYVSEVGLHHAIVNTIINDSTNVSAIQLTTGDSCIAAGDLALIREKGLLRLEYMSADFDMSADNVIVTSNISDRYLPGIVIGYIDDVFLNSNKMSCSGYLKPAVDFEHLSSVLVITTLKETND